MSISVIKAELGRNRVAELRSGLARIAAVWRRWRDRGATLRELQRLDDRALLDIGVARHELRALIEARLNARELRAWQNCWI
jgi:uncharacterized protein YjiS (DUF1127 family)